MQSDSNSLGMNIYVVKGWDYVELINTYKKAIEATRNSHTPALIHVTEVTQPQGHSTSGSHERYKSEERMKWESDFDCMTRFKDWIITNNLATVEELNGIEEKALQEVNQARTEAYEDYLKDVDGLKIEVRPFIELLKSESKFAAEIAEFSKIIDSKTTIYKREILKSVHGILTLTEKENIASVENLKSWYLDIIRLEEKNYGSHLYSESAQNALKVKEIKPNFEQAEEKAGYEIINTFFDKMFAKHSELVAFGEDVGKIGDVNQGFAGLQDKYGENRIFDTGIREASIIGQGQGLSMRGLRPIAEIQYLDYLLYGLMPLSDDVATLQYRTKGGQKAPLIVRTRGHRLEGIWHSGSPMGMIVHSLRGMYVCVPRNLTQAAGMYQTILQSDEPALVIEPLNGYRLKEKMPQNIDEFTVPLGKVEVLHQGSNLTMVSYGSTIRICQETIEKLEKRGISVELIDVQTLLPFDLEHEIVASIKKTNRLVIVDEDVPGGASAYILQQIIENQGAYKYLDSAPKTITAKAHRPAYGTDGDYFSKSNAEEVYENVLEIMKEVQPNF